MSENSAYYKRSQNNSFLMEEQKDLVRLETWCSVVCELLGKCQRRVQLLFQAEQNSGAPFLLGAGELCSASCLSLPTGICSASCLSLPTESIVEESGSFDSPVGRAGVSTSLSCLVLDSCWYILSDKHCSCDLKFSEKDQLNSLALWMPNGLLMKVKEESEKVSLKLNIQKTKIMASGPITSWEIDGETVETVSDFILGVSKITADGDCSHGIKRRLLLGRKVMTNLDSTLKSRDITLPTKVCLVKAMVYPVVMYGCESCEESWALKNWCY